MRKQVINMKKLKFYLLFILSIVSCNKPLDLPEAPGGSVLYVSTDGTDKAVGSQSSPMRSIQKAIAEAKKNSISIIRIAEGTYELTEGNYITMEEGISLYGGYSTNFKNRNTEFYETKIIDLKTFGGSIENPNKAVYFGPEITQKTEINGFTIIAGSGIYNSAIYIEKASPIIKNNKIKGSLQNSVSITSIGIYSNNTLNSTKNSSFIISGNEIFGGKVNSTSGESYGMKIHHSSKTSLIENNSIDGGENGVKSYGIYFENSEGYVSNNSVIGGLSLFANYTIYSKNSTVYIENNSIHGGNSQYTHGIVTEAEEGKTNSTSIGYNKIYGGNASKGWAVAIWTISSTSSIYNNYIFGGNRPKDETSYNPTQCIHNEKSEIYVVNNTMYAGNGSGYSVAIFQSTPDSTKNFGTYINNLIVLGEAPNQYAFAEMTDHANPLIFSNNAIIGPTNYSGFEYFAYYHDYDIDKSGDKNCRNAAHYEGTGIDITEYNCIENSNNIDQLANLTQTHIATTSITGNVYHEISIDNLFKNFNKNLSSIDDVKTLNMELKETISCEIKEGGFSAAPLIFNNDYNKTKRTTNITCSPKNEGAGGWTIGAFEVDYNL